MVDALHIECGFASTASTPQASIVWTDVTQRGLVNVGLSIQRGRSTELDTFQAGSASVTLKNADRLFDPTYTAGTYYGQLLPLRPFRAYYVLGATTYMLFTGYVLGWPQEYEKNSFSRVPLASSDAFLLFSQAEIGDAYFTLDSTTWGRLNRNALGGDGYVDEPSGNRIGKILDGIGWPAADRTVDTGYATIEAGQAQGVGLQAMQTVETGEVGSLYMGSDGKVIFEGRHHRLTATRSKTSQATFGDAGTEIHYSDIRYDYSEKLIKNDARRADAADSTVEATVTDATSITSYFRRTDSKSVPVASLNDLQAQAEMVVYRYSDPQFRIEQLSVKRAYPGSTDFAALLGLRISDRVTVKRRPQGIGTAISQELWVEGISLEVRSTREWTWTIRLSPAGSEAWFIVNTSVLNTGQVAA